MLKQKECSFSSRRGKIKQILRRKPAVPTTPFFIVTGFRPNFREVHSLAYSPMADKNRSRIQIQLFKTPKPIRVVILLHSWTQRQTSFPRKAKAPFLVVSTSGVEAIALLSPADLPLGI